MGVVVAIVGVVLTFLAWQHPQLPQGDPGAAQETGEASEEPAAGAAPEEPGAFDDQLAERGDDDRTSESPADDPRKGSQANSCPEDMTAEDRGFSDAEFDLYCGLGSEWVSCGPATEDADHQVDAAIFCDVAAEDHTESVYAFSYPNAQARDAAFDAFNPVPGDGGDCAAGTPDEYAGNWGRGVCFDSSAAPDLTWALLWTEGDTFMFLTRGDAPDRMWRWWTRKPTILAEQE